MRRSWIMVGGLWALACGVPSYVKTAYSGDLSTLGKQISTAARSGAVDQGAIQDLARAVARRELRSARGKDIGRRIEQSRACARAVEAELEEWADAGGDTAGEALLVLVEAGLRKASSYVGPYARSEVGTFRAVAARGTGTEDDAPLRRAFFSDPDERVRKSAFLAALDALDPKDLPVLLEAARLDPSVENRGLAARAAGAIGGAPATIGLLDLWAAAEPEVQMAIVSGWAAPAAFDSGGSRELLRVAERDDSLSSITAAAELSRRGGPGASEGRAVLLRAIADGTAEERILAIQLGPASEGAAVEALEKAALSDDPPVRVVALARLLEVPGKKNNAIERLREISRQDDAAARQARVALSVARDQQAAPLLARQLGDPDSTHRRQAALALYRLGQAARVAPTFADPDPGVRMFVACAVLSGKLDRT